jgi:hypothetical protein
LVSDMHDASVAALRTGMLGIVRHFLEYSMRAPFVVSALSILTMVSCGGSDSPTSPVTPSPMARATSATGTWIGSLSDSTGTMMGAGLTSVMMTNASLGLTQTGSALNGQMQFAGYRGQMTIHGTISGRSGTMTLVMPTGSMMMNDCSAVASATFDMDDAMSAMSGTYTGSNTCTGPFAQGHFTLSRR